MDNIKIGIFILNNGVSNLYINEQTITASNVEHYVSNLESVIIYDPCTSIGNYAFWDYSGLSLITCEATQSLILYVNTFKNVTNSIPIYVPVNLVATYKAANI